MTSDCHLRPQGTSSTRSHLATPKTRQTTPHTRTAGRPHPLPPPHRKRCSPAPPRPAPQHSPSPPYEPDHDSRPTRLPGRGQDRCARHAGQCLSGLRTDAAAIRCRAGRGRGHHAEDAVRRSPPASREQQPDFLAECPSVRKQPWATDEFHRALACGSINRQRRAEPHARPDLRPADVPRLPSPPP